MAPRTLFFALAAVLACAGRGSCAITIPPPDDDHRFQPAVAHMPLTDATPLDPSLAIEHRKVMASVFLPVPKENCSRTCQTAYMPLDTAKMMDDQFLLGTNGQPFFEHLQYDVCCASDEALDASSFPFVVLEPQVNTSRLLYANLARFISANGVAVLLLDHRGDSSIIEFPSNASSPETTVVNNNGTTPLSPFFPIDPWNSTVTSAISLRVRDISFARAQLSSLPLMQSQFAGINLTSALNTSSYAVVGHGLGGAVASTLSFIDKRVDFSVNLAGTPPLLSAPSNATVYLIGSSSLRRNTDIHWSSTWTHLQGKASEIDLADADIMDLSDLPVVVELAQREGGRPEVQGRGMGDSGAWANHAAVCFAESIVRIEMLGDQTGVSRCVDVFARIAPWLNIIS